MKPAAVFRSNAGLPIKESHFSLGSGPPFARAVGSADVFSVRAIIRFLVDGLHDLREGKFAREGLFDQWPVVQVRFVPERTAWRVRRNLRDGCSESGRVRRRARAAHVKQTPMCAKPRIGRAGRRLRMSLSGLWLHHGLRGGYAAPEPEAVTGATPLFRCPVWHQGGLGCARHPNLPGGRSESISPLQEGQRALEAAASRLGGGVTSTKVSLSASPRCPTVPPRNGTAFRWRVTSKWRRSPWTGGETQPEGAA